MKEQVIELAKQAGITFKPMTIDGVEYQYRHVRFNDNFRGGFDDDEATCIETLIKLVRNAALEDAKQLFPQPHQEYFGREAQDAIESLKEPTP